MVSKFLEVFYPESRPNGSVIGLSKVPRALEVLSKRPQMQERLTEELADMLMEELKPREWPW